MKYLISALLMMIACNYAEAQTIKNRGDRTIKPTGYTILDTSSFEIIYSHTIFDPVLEEKREDLKILEIGQNYSRYSDYGAYQQDSLIAVDYPHGLPDREHTKLSIRFLPSWEATVKDFNNQIMETYDKVFIDRYVYQEPLEPMTWEIESVISKIDGYICFKAKSSFRGREWTAWYCPDFPINNGPWKFGGLPGLIIKIESVDKEHTFQIMGIRKNSHEFGVKKMWYQPTTREKYNRELEDYCTRPTVYFGGNHPFPAKDANGNDAYNPNRRLFFNPIELE